MVRDVGPIQAVRLVRDDARPVPLARMIEQPDFGLVLVLCAALALLGACYRPRRRDDAEAAFRCMCRQLGIRGDAKAIVRTLAGVHPCRPVPVALLLSESSFREAVEALARSEPNRIGHVELAAISRRVFAD